MFKSKRDYLFFITLIIIQLAYFISAIYLHNYNPFIKESFFATDSGEYITQAKNIIDYQISYSGDLSEPINKHFFTVRPPLYPIFLALFYLLNASTIFIFFVQNIISFFSIYLLRDTLLKFNYKKKFDFLFLLFLLLTPSHFIYANSLMSEVLFQFLLVLLFRFAMLFHLHNKDKFLITYSIILVLAILTKPVMYLFIIPSTIYLIILSFKSKKWQPFGVSFIPIISVLLIFQWNFNRTNHYHFSSISSYNLINFNTHLFLMNTKGLIYADKVVDSINNNTNSINNFGKKLEYTDEAAKSILKENFVSYSLFHLKSSFYGLIDPGRYDLTTFFKIKFNSIYNYKEGVLYHLNNGGVGSVFNFLINKYSIGFLLAMILILGSNIFKVLSLLFFLFNLKIDFNLKFISLSIIGYLFILPGPVGASRYIMPIAPLIIGIILIDNYFINFISSKINLWKKE